MLRFGFFASLVAPPDPGPEGEPRLRVQVPGGRRGPGAARDALEPLEPRLEPPLLWNARLLVSEVVTNSVRHAGAGDDDVIVLEVAVSPAEVRVEVCDQGPGFEPHPRPAGPDDHGGRGLFLVDQLADRWGTRDGGRCVWFALDRRSSAIPRALQAAAR